jgi:hypothetical protein
VVDLRAIYCTRHCKSVTYHVHASISECTQAALSTQLDQERAKLGRADCNENFGMLNRSVAKYTVNSALKSFAPVQWPAKEALCRQGQIGARAKSLHLAEKQGTNRSVEPQKVRECKQAAAMQERCSWLRGQLWVPASETAARQVERVDVTGECNNNNKEQPHAQTTIPA